MEKARKFIRELLDIVKRPYMRILPGQLAFFLLMSLIPMVALVGSIANYFSLSLDSLKEVTSTILPLDLSTLFTTSEMTGKGLNFNIIIFFLTAFLLASNGMHSVIITANEIYKYQDEGMILRRLKAISMTFVIVVLLFLLFAFTVFGDTFFELLKEYASSEYIDTISFFETLFNFLKIPLSVLLIYVNIKRLYKMAPEKEIENRTPMYAAVFTTIIWIIGTEIYSIYVKYFANYNLFYGSISNIIILMVWIYFLAYIFVLGMGLSTIDIEKIFKTNK